MFTNIGSKIKTLAKILAWIGIIVSIIIGIRYVILGIENLQSEFVVLGFLCTLIGSLLSWISSFCLYGFGQLVENSDKLIATLVPCKKDSPDNETLTDMNDEEIEIIVKKYAGLNWADNIKKLSNEELQERINSMDWQDEYKILCKKELESRKI